MQALQSLAFPPEWRGLFSRNQDLDLDKMFWARARNVETVGGTPAKRSGTQYVNGWGTLCEPGWTTAGGDVADAGGIQVGDAITVIAADGTASTSTVDTKSGNALTVSPAFTFAPAMDAGVIVRRPLVTGGAPQRVDGLFQATFRNGTQKLLAAAGDRLWDVQASPVGSSFDPATIAAAYPATTVATNWSDPTTGTLTTVQTLRAGDPIRIAASGPAGGVYAGTVVSVDFATSTVVVTPACSSLPQAGYGVQFIRERAPGDTHFVQYANLTHIVGENSQPLKYDGAAVQRHGVLPPIEAPTIVNGSGGGAYTWRYKYRNSVTGAESEPGPATATGQLGTQITLTASPDPQVDMIDLYRTTDGGDGSWYFVQEQANTTATVTDSAADEALGRLMREFLDEELPDSVTVLALWPQANCLVGIDTALNAVVYSDTFDLATGFLKGESWPPGNLIFVSYDDGDRVRAIAPFFDSLLVFKERSVWRIQGTPPDLTIEPVIFRQDLTGVGVFNQKALVIDQNEVVFPGEDGMYLLDRYQGVQQGFQTERISRVIDKEWERLTIGSQKKAHGIFFRQRRQIRLCLPMDGRTEPSEMLVFQFEGQMDGTPHGWTEWSIPAFPDGTATPSGWTPAYTASCVGHGTEDVVYVGTVSGDVLQMDVGTADAGAYPMTFDLAIQWFAPAGAGRVSRGRMVDLVLEALAIGALQIGVGVDFSGAKRTSVLDTRGKGGFVLGTDVLGVGILGPGATRVKARMPFSLPGEYHQISFYERSPHAAFRIVNLTYWHQALTAQLRAASKLQTVARAG